MVLEIHLLNGVVHYRTGLKGMAEAVEAVQDILKSGLCVNDPNTGELSKIYAPGQIQYFRIVED